MEILETVVGWGAPDPEEQLVGDRQSTQKLQVWEQAAPPVFPPCHGPRLLLVAGEKMCQDGLSQLWSQGGLRG